MAGDARPEEDEKIEFRLVKLSEVLKMIDKGAILRRQDADQRAAVCTADRAEGGRSSRTPAQFFHHRTFVHSAGAGPGQSHLWISIRKRINLSLTLCRLSIYRCEFLHRLTGYPARHKEGRNLWLSTKVRSSGLTTPRATDSSDAKTGRMYSSTTQRFSWTDTKRSKKAMRSSSTSLRARKARRRMQWSAFGIAHHSAA